MAGKTIYWHDYETFGIDPRRCRAAQFAGQRTDEDLNPIGQPQVIYCRPGDDFLPDPVACLITGITPRLAQKNGLTEADFIHQILVEFAQAGSCVAGYNSIRFDDELTRQLLYRNFHDPYEREWKSGNSRWDIIDMLRLCAATRPQGINWPRQEDGSVSFKLEALTAANAIAHSDAHDALADVEATMAMARLVRGKQPRLYDYVYRLRNKHAVEAQLDLANQKPLLHVSSRYPAKLGCLALVAPLCRHPVDSNGVIVYDLRVDPRDWIAASVEDIRKRVFSRREELPEGVQRVPLKTLHINRCPIVAPAATLQSESAQRYAIDTELCMQHWQVLRSARGLAEKLGRVFAPETQQSESDPDFMIYSGGFFSGNDRKLMAVVRGSSPAQLAKLNLPFRDVRLPELLFRYRARNYPDTLDAEELSRWEEFRKQRLTDPATVAGFVQSMQEARALASSARQTGALDELQHYVDGLLPAQAIGSVTA